MLSGRLILGDREKGTIVFSSKEFGIQPGEQLSLEGARAHKGPLMSSGLEFCSIELPA